MPLTYQEVVDLARQPLNDADKARYPDSILLMFANHAILWLLKNRPDLFIGQFGNLPSGNAELADTFPLEAGYAMTLADWVTARTELIDDEHATSGRAMAFIELVKGDAPT